VKIGRTSDNDLVLHDHGVSRRHARITERAGRYFAEDVGSANGTQLNGQPLGAEKQLRDGDRITVGPVEFTFVWVPPEDDDDVTRPIRRVMAPPNAKVSPQGLEQAELAAIEVAPTSYQQSMPVMQRPAGAPPPPGPGRKPSSAPDLPAVTAPASGAQGRAPVGPPALASAQGGGAPVVAGAPVGPPVMGAAAPGSSPGEIPVVGAAALARAPAGPPVVGAAAPGRPPVVGTAPSDRGPAGGPPVLGAAAQGRAPAVPPVLGAAAPERGPAGPPVLGASAQGRSPGEIPVVGAGASARAPAGPPVLGASAPGRVPSGPPVVGTGAQGRAPAGPPALASAPVGAQPPGGAPGRSPALAPSAPVLRPPPGSAGSGRALAQNANRPSSEAASAEPADSKASPGASAQGRASGPGLPAVAPPVMTPGFVPPLAPPPSLSAIDADEPEERTLMAIPTMDSSEDASASPSPLLPVPGFDEPEERTLMSIPSASEAPAPQGIAPGISVVLSAPTLEEPEERTLLDLRPITPVSPLVAPPVRHVAAPPVSPATDADEPSTFVGQDDDIPAAPPAESPEPVTFAGQDPLQPLEEPEDVATFAGRDAPSPSPSWSPPVPPPSPEVPTFVGDKARLATAVPPAPLDPGSLLDEAAVLTRIPRPDEDGDATQPLPPDAPGVQVLPGPEIPAPLDGEASITQDAPARSITVVARVEPSSAADKARQKRELGRTLRGRFLLFWRTQSLPKRIGLASAVGIACVGLVALLVNLASSTSFRLPGREPYKLGLDPVTDSFGLGDGVRWVHADDKRFDFQFVSPTRAVAVLHYQASSISRDEVNLSLNGVSLGWVPPDTAQTAERELEQVLPPSLLRRNANNQLLFDNALNPPARDPWRVWNLRLEIIPVPELPPDQLVASAREAAKAGERFYQLKDVGAENLFKAWREYRSAWITLEALDDKPELYEDVRERIAHITTELDQRCSQLMMQFQRAVQFRSRRDAVATLEDVRRRFPTSEHRCHNLAQERAYEHEL
jgi:hypothetical protein